MAFEIEPAKGWDASLRSVIRKQAKSARRSLVERPEGDAEAAHDARKRFKKIRAAHRLARSALPGYAGENARWRDAARRLAGPRDAAALVEAAREAAELVRETVDDAVFRRLIEGLEERQAAAEQALDAIIPAIVDDIDQGLRALKRLEVEGGDDSFPFDGATKTYARGRRALEEAGERYDALLWHELRKRVKYHRHHMRLLRPLWPEEMKARQAMAAELGDVLGLERDLMLLGEELAGEAGGLPKKTARDLRAVLERRRAKLRETALAQARRLYAEKPKALARRLAGYAAAGPAPKAG